MKFFHQRNFHGLKRKAAFFLVLSCWVAAVHAQFNTFHFRHLTSTDGLSDGVVHTVVEDKFGFIWIGTTYGLNRFDGISVKTYFAKPGDERSLTDNFIQSLFRDKAGNLWVGTYRGLCRFDYSTNKFTRFSAPFSLVISDIQQDPSGRIWVGAESGLWTVDEDKLALRKYIPPGNADQQKKFLFGIRQIIAGPDAVFYMATNKGVKIFNPLTQSLSEIRKDSASSLSLSNDLVFSVSIDSSGYLWVACGYEHALLNKVDLKNHKVTRYDHFISPAMKWATNTIQKVMTDRKGTVWVTSSYSGISRYNEKKDDFTDYTANPQISNSILSNANITLYEDSKGIIWLGTPGYGLSFFNPGKEMFYSIVPEIENKLVPETWGRSACEDRDGNLWLATGKGLAKYDRAKQTFTTFSNSFGQKPVLYFNSVRALLEDDQGDIWIGTARGLNRFHPGSGVMDFFDEKQGVPLAFFWMIVKDQNGTVWLGSASGLFRYDREKNRFDDLGRDTALMPYAHRNIQSLYVDRENRLWIGVLDLGLVMYDLGSKTKKILTVKDTLISDTRFSSLAEDRHGIIWIGAENGLNAYDPASGHSRLYTREDGLPSDRTNNIMVDSLDRVWIGTSNGLCMLNAGRDKFRIFDVNDGLLTNQFNEQAAFRSRDGYFVFPNYKGFLVFRPGDYREKSSPVSAYITSFKIQDKEADPATESLEQIHLKPDQNFFSIELAGLNFMNPYECIYAYKLEPFNPNWIYSKKREINYTNVPPGNYTFRYKVITNLNGGEVPEKTVRISISELFYKSTWFRLLVLFLAVGGILAFYRYRLSHREKILVLKNKAQLLEKEKTQVMYESLKQHLNPHFLFNSLTSLRSLIKSDVKTATIFLDDMSKVYRYVLKSGGQELLPLQDELDFVKTFIELQQIRFKEGLEAKINVDETSLRKYIVPVTLQNLVENAIKHNTADRENPLVIEIYSEDGFVVVRNNLQRYRMVETSNKLGLSSLRSLYHYFSDTPIRVFEDEKYFTVKIPLL